MNASLHSDKITAKMIDASLRACAELELMVARLADEIARTHGDARAREFWMEAEAAVLSRQFELGGAT